MSNEKSAKEYFDLLKSKKKKATSEDLQKIYDNCLVLLNKYQITGQTDAMKRLIFHLETIEKERKVLEAGIDTFVYLSDIKEYIEHVQGKSVKIIELSRFERDIPDNIVEKIAKIKGLFHSFFVVFTDYTNTHVEKHRRETDPILFGMFKDERLASVVERMYFIGDWVDEYCDLTLDQMVTQMGAITGKNIEMKIRIPEDIVSLKEQLNKIEAVEGSWRIRSQPLSINGQPMLVKKVSFFKRIFTKIFRFMAPGLWK